VRKSSVVTFRTLESQVNDSLVRERLLATLSGIFGNLAALLATIGLYGVMSCMVARRRQIGIGWRWARAAATVRMVMREAGALLGRGPRRPVAGGGRGPCRDGALFGLHPAIRRRWRWPRGLGLVAMLASYLGLARVARTDRSLRKNKVRG
jgi:hypothetical protein